MPHPALNAKLGTIAKDSAGTAWMMSLPDGRQPSLAVYIVFGQGLQVSMWQGSECTWSGQHCCCELWGDLSSYQEGAKLPHWRSGKGNTIAGTEGVPHSAFGKIGHLFTLLPCVSLLA